MTSFPTEEELFDVVQEGISLALAVEREEVTPDASLIQDLDAESIDFLDITFRLEQFLPIFIPRDDLTEQAEDVFGASAAVDNERRLTPFGAYLVRERLYGVDRDKIETGMKVEQLATLWTVRTWVGLCVRLLETIPEKCEACGGERRFDRDEEKQYKAVCAGCGTELKSAPGDDLNRAWFEELKGDPEVMRLITDARAEAAHG